MKWKSHISIARIIAAEMGLSEELERGLCNGSVEPDRRPDSALRGKGRAARLVRAPHHTPPTGMIMAYLWRARRAYLIGNDYWAMKNLGRALHYIQDKSVSPGRGFRRHDAREEYVADLLPPREAVVAGFEVAECSPGFVRRCVEEVRPLGRPEDILFQATLYSAAITAAVLGPPDPDDALISRYLRAARAHRYRPILGGALAVISSAIVFNGHPVVGTAGVLAAIVAIIDPLYHRVHKEAEWFDMEAQRS